MKLTLMETMSSQWVVKIEACSTGAKNPPFPRCPISGIRLPAAG
jgi:hypothetical protein